MATANISSSGVLLRSKEGEVSAGAETAILDGSFLSNELSIFKKELWQSKKLSDFTLKARGRCFNVHKLIIAGHMSYYDVDSSELSQEAAILDIEPDHLELVLKFLYLGHLEVPREFIPSLKDAADYLGVDALQKQCTYVSLYGVDLAPNNCLDIWSAALDVEENTMADKALQMAVKHFDEIQHDSRFSQLPVVCLLQLLSHSELKLQSPDEALGAALSWLTADPDGRVEHLPIILDMMPLEAMQGWYLRQVMHNPVVRASKEACSLLKATMEGSKNVTPVSKEYCTNMYWMTFKVDKKKGQPSTAQLWSVSLHRDMAIKQMGQGPDMSGHISMCSGDDGDLYIGGLVKYHTELWKFHIPTQKYSRIGSFIEGRERYAMCYMNGYIYIFGGVVNYRETSGVEVCNLNNGRITAHGTLMYGGVVFCHPTSSMDQIVLFGAYGKDGCTTVQLYSLEQQTTTAAVSLPWQSFCYPIAILAVDKSNFLLFSQDYTAVCNLHAIKQGKSKNIRKCDRYVTPNNQPGVALSVDEKFVMLLGGAPKPSNPRHSVYRAQVKDIVNNTGDGWEKVEAAWPLGEDLIYAQATITLP